MRIGAQLPTTASIADRVEMAVWAEANGFDDAWTAEIADPDAFVVLAAVAARTERIRLGTMIVPLGVRSVASLAASTASLCQLAPERFCLGLGVSTEAVVSGWHGGNFRRPLERARETLEALRPMLAGEKSAYEGNQVRSTGFKLQWPPASPPPLMLAALNEQMLRLAGAASDGTWLNFLPLDAVPAARDAVADGARAAGRSAIPELLLSVICRVTDDPEAARQEYRSWFRFYMSAPPYQKALEWYGFGEEVAMGRKALADGDRQLLAEAVSDRLIDGLTAFGPADHCRNRIEEYAEAGIDTLVVIPYGPGTWHETLSAWAR